MLNKASALNQNSGSCYFTYGKQTRIT